MGATDESLGQGAHHSGVALLTGRQDQQVVVAGFQRRGDPEERASIDLLHVERSRVQLGDLIFYDCEGSTIGTPVIGQ